MSPDFRSNPTGTFFDPEKVYEVYASGQYSRSNAAAF